MSPVAPMNGTHSPLDPDAQALKASVARSLRETRFARLSAPDFARVVAALQPTRVGAGETVVKQGERGEAYFVIGAGQCQVEQARPGAPPAPVAELGPGDAFGEEALIVNGTRNASVRMLTDGTLLRLPRQIFMESVRRPLLRAVDYPPAVKAVQDGRAVWLDVRHSREVAASGLPGALAMPLRLLRQVAGRLRRDRRYIAYCEHGGRSAVAAFLLAERGFDVLFLAGGLARHGLLAPPDLELLSASFRPLGQAPAGGLLPTSQLTAREQGGGMTELRCDPPPPAAPAARAVLAPQVASAPPLMPVGALPPVVDDIEDFEQTHHQHLAARRQAGALLTPAEHLARERARAERKRQHAEAHARQLLSELEDRLAED